MKYFLSCLMVDLENNLLSQRITVSDGSIEFEKSDDGVKCVSTLEIDLDDGSPEKILPIADSIKKFMSLSIPAILSFFLIQI